MARLYAIKNSRNLTSNIFRSLVEYEFDREIFTHKRNGHKINPLFNLNTGWSKRVFQR